MAIPAATDVVRALHSVANDTAATLPPGRLGPSALYIVKWRGPARCPWAVQTALGYHEPQLS
jgi:hypothetical protein